MSTHIVTYDLHQAGQNYDGLINKIKEYGAWCHIQGSVWAVRSKQSCAQIRDNLSTHIDANDSIFVAKLTGEAAWRGLSDKKSSWFKQAA